MLEGRIAALFKRAPTSTDFDQSTTPKVIASFFNVRDVYRVFERVRVPSEEAVALDPLGFVGSIAFQNSVRWTKAALIKAKPSERALLVQTSAHHSQLRDAAAAGGGLGPLREPLEESTTFSPGAWGENLFLDGDALDAASVCVGDEFALFRDGRALPAKLQVTSPRLPCGKVDQRHGATFSAAGVRTHCARTGQAGFFVRPLPACDGGAAAVLGDVRAGDVARLVARPHPAWDLARVSRLLYGHPDALANYLGRCAKVSRDPTGPATVLRAEWQGTLVELRELAAVPELSVCDWKEVVHALLASEGKPPVGRYRRKPLLARAAAALKSSPLHQCAAALCAVLIAVVVYAVLLRLHERADTPSTTL